MRDKKRKNAKCLFCSACFDWRLNVIDYKNIIIPIYVCDEHLELGKIFSKDLAQELISIKKTLEEVKVKQKEIEGWLKI